MFNWAKQQLANVAGTQEPIYGPSAIKSVATEAAAVPYTETGRDDLRWQAPGGTAVETQTFYLNADDGTLGLVQVIYSSVAGLRTSTQFNSKIMWTDPARPHQWCATQLSNHDFSDDRASFYADDCAVELSPDGTAYSIKSMNDDRAVVSLTIRRLAPGFHAGRTGRSLFGTDPEHPWGEMRHAVWPRCAAEGTIVTKDGPVDFRGRAMFVYALQGMKPHHLAARWSFVNFQAPSLSAVLVAYTTPPSYGCTVVSVGGIARDGEIVVAGADCAAAPTRSARDPETEWPAPEAMRWTWAGKTADGRDAEAVIEGDLDTCLDRVDVMAEVPSFVKSIVASAVGTKPYIYMYAPRKNKLSIRLKIGQEEIVEEGQVFAEATFISGLS